MILARIFKPFASIVSFPRFHFCIIRKRISYINEYFSPLFFRCEFESDSGNLINIYKTYRNEEDQAFFISVACRNLTRILRPSPFYSTADIERFFDACSSRLIAIKTEKMIAGQIVDILTFVNITYLFWSTRLRTDKQIKTKLEKMIDQMLNILKEPQTIAESRKISYFFKTLSTAKAIDSQKKNILLKNILAIHISYFEPYNFLACFIHLQESLTLKNKEFQLNYKLFEMACRYLHEKTIFQNFYFKENCTLLQKIHLLQNTFSLFCWKKESFDHVVADYDNAFIKDYRNILSGTMCRVLVLVSSKQPIHPLYIKILTTIINSIDEEGRTSINPIFIMELLGRQLNLFIFEKIDKNWRKKLENFANYYYPLQKQGHAFIRLKMFIAHCIMKKSLGIDINLKLLKLYKTNDLEIQINNRMAYLALSTKLLNFQPSNLSILNTDLFPKFFPLVLIKIILQKMIYGKRITMQSLSEIYLQLAHQNFSVLSLSDFVLWKNHHILQCLGYHLQSSLQYSILIEFLPLLKKMQYISQIGFLQFFASLHIPVQYHEKIKNFYKISNDQIASFLNKNLNRRKNIEKIRQCSRLQAMFSFQFIKKFSPLEKLSVYGYPRNLNFFLIFLQDLFMEDIQTVLSSVQIEEYVFILGYIIGYQRQKQLNIDNQRKFVDILLNTGIKHPTITPMIVQLFKQCPYLMKKKNDPKKDENIKYFASLIDNSEPSLLYQIYTAQAVSHEMITQITQKMYEEVERSQNPVNVAFNLVKLLQYLNQNTVLSNKQSQAFIELIVKLGNSIITDLHIILELFSLMSDFRWYHPQILQKISFLIYDERYWNKKYDVVKIYKKISEYPKQRGQSITLLKETIDVFKLSGGTLYKDLMRLYATETLGIKEKQYNGYIRYLFNLKMETLPPHIMKNIYNETFSEEEVSKLIVDGKKVQNLWGKSFKYYEGQKVTTILNSDQQLMRKAMFSNVNIFQLSPNDIEFV